MTCTQASSSIMQAAMSGRLYCGCRHDLSCGHEWTTGALARRVLGGWR